MSSESSGKQFVLWFVGSFVLLSGVLFGVRTMRSGMEEAATLQPTDGVPASDLAAGRDFTRPPGAGPDWEPPALRAGTDLAASSLGAESATAIASAPPDGRLPPRPLPGMTAEPPDAVAFDAIPEPLRAGAVLDALDDLDAWFGEQDEALGAAYLGTDCSYPPCLTGMAYDAKAFDDAEARAAFQRGFLDEVGKRLGSNAAVSIVSAGPEGTSLFTYVLPAEASPETRAALEASASHRHHAWMASGGGPVGGDEDPDEDE